MRHILLLLCLVAASVQAQRRSVSILGDSYSTYEHYITPETNEPWYFENEDPNRTDVSDVTETWWHILCTERGFKLETNNSYSGATISYTGYDGEDYSPRSFITRAANVGCPDILLIFGGTNDSWAGSPLGEMKWSAFERSDFFSYRPAMCYLAEFVSKRYPNTDIYFILNTELKPEIGDAMRKACERYGLKVIELHDISKINGHPDVEGMKSIAEQVSQAIGD